MNDRADDPEERITVRVPVALANHLRVVATREHSHLSVVVRRVLTDGLAGGRQFYDRDVPAMVAALERMAVALEAIQQAMPVNPRVTLQEGREPVREGWAMMTPNERAKTLRVYRSLSDGDVEALYAALQADRQRLGTPQADRFCWERLQLVQLVADERGLPLPDG